MRGPRTPEREQFSKWLDLVIERNPAGVSSEFVDQTRKGFDAGWKMGREGLLEALRLADELVRTDGHTLTPPCKFGGCTCGGIEAYKVARSNYVRARREALLGTEKERKS